MLPELIAQIIIESLKLVNWRLQHATPDQAEKIMERWEATESFWTKFLPKS